MVVLDMAQHELAPLLWTPGSIDGTMINAVTINSGTIANNVTGLMTLDGNTEANVKNTGGLVIDGNVTDDVEAELAESIEEDDDEEKGGTLICTRCVEKVKSLSLSQHPPERSYFYQNLSKDFSRD
jgi:hypothetical protein